MALLKLIGVMNAAVWLGSAVFLTFVAGPAFFSPEMKDLHQIKYRATSTSAQRQSAARSFNLWHGVAQGTNLIMTAGVLVYLLGSASPEILPRVLGGARPDSHR